MSNKDKPIIETMINTTAILLTGAGGTMAVSGEWWGLLLITFGMILEFSKYYGRQKLLW